jgi:mRNA interferase MazF
MPITNKTGIVDPLIRGDVYLVNLESVGPAVIIQNDTGNKFSPVSIIAPISSMKDITKMFPVMVSLKQGEGGLDNESYVDCGQIRTIDKSNRLITKLGSLGKSKMLEVDRALKISLAL